VSGPQMTVSPGFMKMVPGSPAEWTGTPASNK